MHRTGRVAWATLAMAGYGGASTTVHALEAPAEPVYVAQMEGADLGALPAPFAVVPGTVYQDSPTANLGYERVRLEAAPLILSASTRTSHLQLAIAQVDADYQIEIVGGAVGTPATLRIAFAMMDDSAFTLPQDPVLYETAVAESSLYIETDQTYRAIDNSSYADQGPSITNGGTNFSMTIGTIGVIDLVADAHSSYGGNATAWIDPAISIVDPTPGESLLLSPGVGDTSPGLAGLGAPEPAAWAMMLIGLAVVGGATRRRRAAPPIMADGR